MSFALGVLPVILLLLGFPIFIVLLAAVSTALMFFMHMPLAALHQNMFGSINAFASNQSHLVIDVTGYFAPGGASNSQRFFTVAPCRLVLATPK